MQKSEKKRFEAKEDEMIIVGRKDLICEIF